MSHSSYVYPPAQSILEKAHSDETFPACKLPHQGKNLSEGLLRVQTVHPNPNIRVGYRALAFDNNGDLSPCYDVQDTPAAQATRQSLPAKGVIVSFHFGLLFGTGVTFITEIDSKPNGSKKAKAYDRMSKATKGMDLNLVTRLAEINDYNEKGIIAKIRAKNPWVQDFFKESYTDAVLGQEHKHGTQPMKNRSAYVEAMQFSELYGISLDANILAGTTKVHFKKHAMPSEEALAKQLFFPTVWDPEARRGFECELYGSFSGVVGGAEKIKEKLDNTDEALALARTVLDKYDEIIRLATVYHTAADGEPFPCFYMFLIYSKSVKQTGEIRTDASELTALIDRWSAGELDASCFPIQKEGKAEVEISDEKDLTKIPV